MDLKIPMKVQIWYATPETTRKEDNDIDYPIEECTTRIMKIYSLEGICAYQDEVSGNKYGRIFSGGEPFTTTLSLSELDKLIETHRL